MTILFDILVALTVIYLLGELWMVLGELIMGLLDRK